VVTESTRSSATIGVSSTIGVMGVVVVGSGLGGNASSGLLLLLLLLLLLMSLLVLLVLATLVEDSLLNRSVRSTCGFSSRESSTCDTCSLLSSASSVRCTGSEKSRCAKALVCHVECGTEELWCTGVIAGSVELATGSVCAAGGDCRACSDHSAAFAST